MSTLHTGAALLAAGIDNRPGDDLPGLLAFLVVALLVVACVVLFRSMRTRLKNITFDEGDPSTTTSTTTGTTTTRPERTPDDHRPA